MNANVGYSKSGDVQVADAEIDTGWSNPPLLADLKGDLTEATSHHNAHVTDVEVWLDNLNLTGGAVIKAKTGHSSVQPRLIRKQAEWRYAALSESFLSHEDLFTTAPVTFEDGDAAVQNGLILNNQFNTKIDKVGFIDDYVRALVDEGSAVIRVGWDFYEKEVEVPNMVVRPIQDPEMYKMVEEAAELLMQDPEGAADQIPKELMDIVMLSLEIGSPVESVQEGTKMEMQTIRNQPTVEVCEYNAVIIDPTCKGDLDKANFAIYQFDTSKGDLERDGRYSNLDEINIERNAVNQDGTTPMRSEGRDFAFKDEPRKKITAYEYWGFWDINDTGVPVSFVCTWVGDTVIRLEESPFPDGKVPFVLVSYLPKRKSIYGEPDGALLEDNQKIAGAVTRGMLDIMGRSAAGQIGIRKDAMDVTNMRKFESGKDYYFNPHIDARSAFHEHIYPELPASAPFMLQQQNNEAEAYTGVKAFSQGITGDGLGKSATAARSAIDAAGKREVGILRRLASGVIQVGRKIMAMNAELLSDEEVVRVTNEEFITVKRDDLAGKIDIKLMISTAEADNAKAQELAFMLQTTGNSLPMEFSQLIMEEIARLRKMPELAKRIQEFQPQPDPVAQKMQELEIAKLEAEIDKIRSEAEENRAEAALDVAQAGKAVSERDKTDLDFVEQQSGVKQDRELQKQGEQARGNARLEMTKAILSTDGGNQTKTG